MFKNPRAWLYGLLSSVIGGSASAGGAAVGGIVVAPDTFNLASGLHKTLGLMGIAALFGAVTHLFAYLAKSPLPEPGNDTEPPFPK